MKTSRNPSLAVVRTFVLPILATGLFTLPVGCGADSTSQPPNGSSGAGGVAGTVGTGGASNEGGAPGTGGGRDAGMGGSAGTAGYGGRSGASPGGAGGADGIGGSLGCWKPEVVDEGSSHCRDDKAIYEPECLQSMYPKLDDNRLLGFQQAYTAKHGGPLDSTCMPDQTLGFFIDENGVYISALHAHTGWCLPPGRVTKEYLAGRDGPPIECDFVDLLYVGPAAEALPPCFDCDPCFDCIPPEKEGDIVVGRVKPVPSTISVVRLADASPALDSPVVAVGKPDAPDTVPYDERRAALGRMKGTHGRSVVVSDFLIPGFSGGPMLDSCGNAFGVSVTKVTHLEVAYPPEWDRTWTIGVSLIEYRTQISAALQYARSH